MLPENIDFSLENSLVTSIFSRSESSKRNECLVIFIGGTGEYSPVGYLSDGSNIGYEKLIFGALDAGFDVISFGHTETGEKID